MGSKAKDASSKVHEKNQTILADLLRDEDNRYCADCHAKGPRWASWNLGVFICIRCAGIHRNLGVHISRVKSVNLDAWTPEQMEAIKRGGNRLAKEKYEANLPANFRRPQDDYAVEQFIRSKYEKKLYIDKGGSPSSTNKPSTSSSSTKSTRPSQPPQENRLKVKKSQERKTTPPKNEVMSVPRPSTSRRSPSPQPPLSASSSKHTSSNSLIALESSPLPSSASSSSIPGLDLLTDTPTAAATTNKPRQNTPDLLMGPLQSGPPANPPAAQQGASFSPFSNPVGQTQPSVSGQPNFGTSKDQPSLLLDPSLIPEQTKQDVKDSIMSLYSSQPQYGAYTAQGYPVNAYHYNQQQQAAMRMAQMQHVAQHRQQQMQLQQVQQQMQAIKVGRQQHPMAVGNGSFPSPVAPGGGMGGGGHTLNPHLW